MQLTGKKYYFVLILVGMLFSSCLTIKPSSSKSPKKYYETFYTEQGIQYFIKPLSLKSDSKETMEIDFTFRNTEENPDSATINFSIYSSEPLKNIEKMYIRNEQHEFSEEEFKLLYSELDKKEYHFRYSISVPTPNIINLFENEDWILEIIAESGNFVFYPEKKSKQVIVKLREGVFNLF